MGLIKHVVALVLFAAAATAQERFASNIPFSNLQPGQVLQFRGSCPLGYYLLSGGYSVTQANPVADRLAILQNHAHSTREWAVKIQNITPGVLGGHVQITLLCKAE
jgi:hypothetical protein